MTEWILPYECVCRRQEQYLQQIKDLRQQFQHQNGDKRQLSRCGNAGQSGTQTGPFWGPPPSPSTKPNVIIPDTVCILYPTKTQKHSSVCKDSIQASDTVMIDATDYPTTQKSGLKNQVSLPAVVPQRLGIDRHKTDYEPIEHIARRNKLNFSKYFRDGQTWAQCSSSETGTAISDINM
ncbi:unnamed protein product [Candidula unifasciata]|uniref:Uncharacterized protein n=1 Tax=Candidula unifasciata TaxID=100452 RepID=A0A8S3YP42_9EUPU|nr:unnamed protein product [Candidula unifasciata]